MTIEIQVLD